MKDAAWHGRLDDFLGHQRKKERHADVIDGKRERMRRRVLLRKVCLLVQIGSVGNATVGA